MFLSELKNAIISQNLRGLCDIKQSLYFLTSSLHHYITNLIRKSAHLNSRNSRLSVYVSGENLCTITNYTGIDPECGGWDAMKYPVARTFSFGVKLTY
jgi:hypothetical protein